MIRISVIIPIYNSEEYLSECLDSVVNQTFCDIEIILVDDGSTDDSLRVCREYEKRDQRIRVLHQKNAGSTNARKAGLKKAKGEYITFVDSDDWIDSCFCERLYELAEVNHADMVVSGCAAECEEGVQIRCNRFEEGYYTKETLRDYVYPQMLYYEDMNLFSFGILQYLWCKLYKKSLIESCLYNLDERIYDGEDVASVYDICLRASSMVIDNHPYYHYRIHENSICTSKRDEKYFVNMVYLYHYMNRVFQESGEYEKMLPQLKRYMNKAMNTGMLDIFGYQYVKSYAAAVWSMPEIPSERDCKVAIFGAGVVGKSYYKQLIQMDYIDIAAWVDNFKYKQKVYGVWIDSPDVLMSTDYDYVIVAVKDREKADQIIIWLMNHGVASEKILYKKTKMNSKFYELIMEV